MADPDVDAEARKLEEPLRAALSQGVEWLLRQQEGGAWRSKTYGQLKEGPAITCTVIWSLLGPGVPLRQETHAAALAAVREFLAKGLARTKSLSAPDGSLDYPVYAAAMLLIAHRNFEPEYGALLTNDQVALLTRYLVTAQCGPTRDFEATRPDHGGWDLFGAETKGISSGTNISATRFVLQALALANPPVADDVHQRAREWLARCYASTPDSADGNPRPGGFVFSPEPGHLGNKAEWFDEAHTKPRPYGTTTCDGLLAVAALHADRPLDGDWQKRRDHAIAWLVAHDQVGVDPGFEEASAESNWAESLRFYYATGLAECLPHLPPQVAKRRAITLAKSLLAMQAKDGSWKSEAARMREDDPLIATSFAVAALGRVRVLVAK